MFLLPSPIGLFISNETIFSKTNLFKEKFEGTRG